MSTSQTAILAAQQNQLLLALPKLDLDQWQSRLQLVELSQNQVLHEVGRKPEYVYFLTTAVVSLMSTTMDGNGAEVAMVGNDGVVGITWLMDAETSLLEAVVSHPGRAYRISTSFVKAEMQRSSAVLKTVMRYAQTVFVQISQTAVCNRHHSVEQQLCRRLLSGFDRLGSDEMAITHERIGNMLGVRREGVSLAANMLQEEGLIRYKRGHISLLDREGLEDKACECYEAVNQEYRRLRPIPMAA